jgi:glycosyltransferase involved in cell wall biosynthesis
MTPVYNGADSLSACLDSVRAQNYKNRIHLVADNASTDGSRQIAEGFAAQDPRIHVLSFRELPPVLENFNRAFAAIPSSAVYLKQLNVDDTLHPTCLEKMLAAAAATPRSLSSSVALPGIGRQSTKCSGAGCSTVGTPGCERNAARDLKYPRHAVGSADAHPSAGWSARRPGLRQVSPPRSRDTVVRHSLGDGGRPAASAYDW